MKLKDETGLALPLILVVVFVLTVLGTTLYMLSTTETRQVLHDENKMKAHYLARSGAHAVASKIINNPDIADALVNAGASEPYYFGDGHYRVEVAYMDGANPDESKIVVKSTGVVNNISQSIDVTIEKVDIDAPVYGRSLNISGAGGEGIRGGDVIYGGGDLDDLDPAMRDNIESLLKDGVLREGPFNFASVVLPCADTELEAFGSCPAGPVVFEDIHGGNSVVEINDSVYYDEIEIGNNDDLKISPVNGDNILIKADQIDIGNNALTTVTLTGGSIVAIVVDGEINNRGHILVQAGEEGDDPEGGHLLIYVKDYNKGFGDGNRRIDVDGNVAINFYILADGTLNISGTPNFTGSIYGPDAKSIQRGNAAVVGWIIANEVESSGGMDVQFLRIPTINTSMSLDFYSEERWRYLD